MGNTAADFPAATVANSFKYWVDRLFSTMEVAWCMRELNPPKGGPQRVYKGLFYNMNDVHAEGGSNERVS